MHTGLEEVVNLGWKLAAMTEGWGGPALLASYEIERRPIAVRNVELATQILQRHRRHSRLARGHGRLEGQSGVAVDPRAHEAALLLRGLADLRAGRHACARGRSQAVRAVDPARHARAARLARGRALDARSVRRRLSCCCASAPSARRRARCSTPQPQRGVPLREVTIADPEIAALYERPLVLVRPDGHVAWRGDECPADAAAVVDRVRGARQRPR